jgi:hypothetical protein
VCRQLPAGSQKDSRAEGGGEAIGSDLVQLQAIGCVHAKQAKLGNKLGLRMC